MEQQPFDHTFAVKDDLSIKDTFVDGVNLITIQNSTARILFTVSRPDEPKPGRKGPPTGQKITAARLVMPLNGLAGLYNKLDQLIKGLETQGLVVRGAGGVKPTVQ